MTTEDQTGEFEIVEQLTAYLDGELDDEARAEVERRLGEDPRYLAEMQALQQTWDMLDSLPQTQPNHSFTQTTMELVVGDARKEARKSTFSWYWPARLATALVLASLLFAVGFGWLRNIQQRPDRVLLEQLRVIENMQRYESVDLDLEFVQAMHERQLFTRNEFRSFSAAAGALDSEPTGSDETVDSTVPDVLDDETTLEQRQAWIKALDLDEKEKLKRKLDEFLELPANEQQKLIEFDRQLMAEADHEELAFVIHEYHDWLKMLEIGPRSRLRDEPLDQRLKSIAMEREKQALAQFGNLADDFLPTEDADIVFNWFLGAINAREKEIRERFPEIVKRTREELQLGAIPERILDRLASRAQLNQMVDYLIDADPSYVESMLVDDSSVDLLYVMLSPESRRQLNDQSEDGRRDLLMNWVKRINRSYYNISQERLREFAKTLPQQERDRLDQLSTPTYFARLRQLYLQQNRPGNDPIFDWRRFLNSEIPSRR